MPIKRFNRPQLVDSLRAFFKIDGEYSAAVEDVIGVTAPLVASLDDTPFIRFSVPVGGYAGQAAVAAENAVVLVRPGASGVLDIRALLIQNSTAGAFTLRLGLLTNAQVTTAGVTLNSQLKDLSNGNITAPGAIDRPSAIYTGTHTAIVGTLIGALSVPANSSLLWQPPGTVATLFGSDSQPALAIWNATQNEEISNVTFWGREWVPG